MKNIFFVFSFLLLLSGSLRAEEATDLLTLEESIKIALERSAALHAAREEIRGREFAKKIARAEFLPKLSTGYSYTRLNEAPHAKQQLGTGKLFGNKTFDTEFGTEDIYNFSLNCTQPLFTGGALITSYRLAKLGINIARLQSIAVKQDLIREVKESYFEILKAQKIKKVAVQALEQVKEHVKVAQAFYDVGIIPKNDLLEAEVELAQIKQDLIIANNVVELAKSYFNIVLRREISEPVAIEDILEYQPVTLSLDECIAEAYKERSELKEVNLNIEQAKKGVVLAKSGFYPQVSLMANYERMGDDFDVRGTEIEDAESWNIITGFEWTFWEWGKTKYEVGRTRTALAQAKDAKIQTKDGITLEVKEDYLNLEAAEKNIFVARTAIEQAEENFRMNQERYREQIATSTDVLDAQTLRTQAKTNYYNTLSFHNIAKAKLERAMGIFSEDAI